MKTKFEGLNNDPIVDEAVDDKVNEVSMDDARESQNESRIPTDPNKIQVRVSDKSAPIILLFGAPSSGKTMTLVRLAKYLRQNGYAIKVDENFVTTRDVWEYEKNSRGFNKMLGTTTALGGTNRNDFLFVQVLDKRGTVVCQILEGAGEDYFPKDDVNRVTKAFPAYMNGVLTAINKKIWVFITEPNWKVNQDDKDDYVKRIKWCKSTFFSGRDKAIILYNKIDTMPDLLFGMGKVHMRPAMKRCNDEYTGIFDIFQNPSPLAGFLLPKYLCKFVPFCTGQYTDAVSRAEQNYTLSYPSYPAALWEAIMKSIKS